MEPLQYAVTQFFATLDWAPFTAISQFFHDYAYSLVAILSLIVAPFLRKRGRYYAIAAAMVIVIIASLWLKDAYAAPRPCQEWLLNAKVCPTLDDYGFPSGHTAFAFVFVAASLGTLLFPIVLSLGVVIGISRIYLGVHSLADVAGGAALGIAAYLFAEELVDWYFREMGKETKEESKEEGRKE